MGVMLLFLSVVSLSFVVLLFFSFYIAKVALRHVAADFLGGGHGRSKSGNELLLGMEQFNPITP